MFLHCAEDQIDSLFSFACRADDEAFIIFQHLQPALDICGVVAQAVGGFETCMVYENGSADFCHQFFFVSAQSYFFDNLQGRFSASLFISSIPFGHNPDIFGNYPVRSGRSTVRDLISVDFRASMLQKMCQFQNILSI